MKNYFGETKKYDDIINLPHHVSETHPQMPVEDRAAQFAPFAALTGYGDAIRETARVTDKKIQIDEEQKEILDHELQMLINHPGESPEITVTYFLPDEKKEGGSYRNFTGKLKKVDPYRKILFMEDGTEIPIEDITGLPVLNSIPLPGENHEYSDA